MRYVIVGNGAAGMTAADTLRRLDAKSEITIISGEKGTAYARCLTPHLLGGEIEERELVLRSADHYAALDLCLISGHTAMQVDTDRRVVKLDRGDEVFYDRLLLAPGASPIMPALPGIAARGVYTLRTVEDVRGIAGQAEMSVQAAVLGGGLIGLMAADALRRRGLEVAVIEAANHLLPQQLDAIGAEIYRREFEKHGVRIMTGVRASALETGLERGQRVVEAVALDNGSLVPCQLLVVAVGVRANKSLAEQAGIAVGQGIMVDERLATSTPEVFAAGDAIEGPDLLLGRNVVGGIWPLAVKQGRIAAYNMAGYDWHYRSEVTAKNALGFFGVPAISIGLTQVPEGKYEVLSQFKPRSQVYKRVVLEDDVIVGATFMGDIQAAGVVGALIREQRKLGDLRTHLLDPDFGHQWLE